MAFQRLVFKNFEGGWSTDLKVGLKNSFANSQSIDFRKSPSQLTVLPGTRREDPGIISDLILNETMTENGTIYATGSLGKFYKRTPAGVWSEEAQISSGCGGIDYRKDTDSVYVTSNKNVSVLNNVSGSTVMQADYFGPSYSTYDNSTNAGFHCAAFNPKGTNTYTLKTAINEQQTDLRYFQSDIEPLNKISIFVVSKGTGDWTLTLHDGLNKVLGTVTVTNANLIAGTFNDFVFSSATNGQVRIYTAPNARTYHLHVTSTIADGTLSTNSTNDLSVCSLEVWADRLVQTNNGFHPIERFQQFECIGNGNYLSVWEPISDPPTNAEWQRHKLVFPMQYEVCGIAVMNEYIAIAVERAASSTSNTPQDGVIFFWDGLSDTYNYYVRIPEGAPYGIHEYKNSIYYYAGGDWYGISSPTTVPVKIRNMPGSDTTYSGSSSYFKIYPYAATIRRGVHLMAWPSETNNTSVNFGVYSWGAVDKNFPESFGYNYLISTGSQNYSAQNNLRIGMVKSFGDVLHISWRDDLDGGYGIDVIDNSSNPASASSWQSIIFDNGIPTKRKKAIYMKVSYLTLPSGATITPQYSLGRGSFVNGPTYSTTNQYQNHPHYCRLDIPEGDFLEIQLGLSLGATTATPTITAVQLAFDDNSEEGVT